MKAMKNLVHIAVLLVWAVAGVVFSLKAAFGLGMLASVALFWGWFAGYTAVSTWLTRTFEGPLAVLGVHAGALLLMQVMPRELPFGLLRIGLDLLAQRPLPF